MRNRIILFEFRFFDCYGRRHRIRLLLFTSNVKATLFLDPGLSLFCFFQCFSFLCLTSEPDLNRLRSAVQIAEDILQHPWLNIKIRLKPTGIAAFS
ncbi:hypothetical protein Y5W_03606 [Alcanivorax sp. 521-1]|uniref:Uncharacterized protein n=1 Tax=Alloalcanivorax profundimaris TaxID=2735259 RepID=A0ABS0AXI8_9GAMM|nr:hypothetical protein [Alloalcanivorax profundimaris]